MKGILLKDFYLLIKYCKAYFILIAVFAAVSLYADNNLFFMTYPCVFAALLPVTLYSYDEREKWCTYSQTLPISKTQYVSAKYLLGLISLTATTVLIAAVYACKMMMASSFELSDFLFAASGFFSLGLLMPGILLPFMFKFGSEKGRFIYYFVIGVIVAVVLVIQNRQTFSINQTIGIPFICLSAILLYLLSWILSVSFYKKREI